MIYPIATVKSDYNKMLAAGFPIELVETADTHNGTSTDWVALVDNATCKQALLFRVAWTSVAFDVTGDK